MADNDALSPWEHALASGITAATWRAPVAEKRR
jgi:hypothetical protein